MTLKLREYQKDCIDALYRYFEDERGKAPCICCPTGSGKSLIIGEFVRRVCTESPHVKIMVVTDSRDLVSQNEKELKSYWPQAKTGIYSAGLNKKETSAQVTFASIQSVYRKVFEMGKIDIVIIDEAHAIPREATTRYGQFFSDLRTANHDVVIWGASATLYRMDSGYLYVGEDAIFDGLAYSVEVADLIEQKYLVPVISKGGIKRIDLTNVHTLAGEFKQNELAMAADDPELVRAACQEIIECGKDRKSWLVFATGITHAVHIVETMKEQGIDADLVTGETPYDERDKIINDFKSGHLRCLVNVAVLTKGFNCVGVDLVALMTATQSTSRYVQIVGRGMRTAPGKENCLLLDFGGNVERFGVIDDVTPYFTRSKRERSEEPLPAPVKECPACRYEFNTAIMVCPFCGYKFPEKINHGAVAYSGPVLQSQVVPTFVEITRTTFNRHKKEGKPDSIKVSFYPKLGTPIQTWIALDHGGTPAEVARKTVKTFGGRAKTVDEALEECKDWKIPSAIKVRPKGKYFEVVGVIFPEVFSNATSAACLGTVGGQTTLL